ncbi:carbamoyl phosphate synthase small subunit [Sporanaerobium hydrogeniformans]|uniref:Carbamoyl phosphate synthase small subunit n=1 Tax=Sporanaerobium hydrogeniformans TaxID=3072179 RepID=A0AC61DF02_9FIRM|nr:carbamoyl phosphate synthase small subunit [Sporanaerobium hydrogeniformans]PHV71854.1 carbamoyl phosphate synthase small subunit [Sporanaerobium hydrogeniformans]
MKAQLILENGMVFEGKAFGYLKETIGEVVFNTGMTGYQEILTDPSYYGQMVVMTYPLIGNYGINLEDMESSKSHVRALIVRENSDYPNNFRCELTLDGYLKSQKVIGLEGIDTRALTRVLREHGTMRAIIAVRELTPSQIKLKIDAFNNQMAVSEVTTQESYVIEGNNTHIAVIDCGIKSNILRSFEARGCKLSVFPASATSEEILAVNPDGIFLSNGPADPKDVPDTVATVKVLIGKKPITAICLGHQLLCLALGGNTAKLKFGHHGCNHPVKDFITNRVYITSQNHNYYVETLPEGAVVTHTNMNDQTVEGMYFKDLDIYSVQFHPEACPGPTDTAHIFDEFITVMQGGKLNA